MSATTVVLLTLVGYQALLLGVGYWARSRAQGTAGYFIGDRGLGPWVAALSYAAGSSSAWSILGVSGIAFSQGIGSVWLLPGTITGHIVVWFWVAPRLQTLAHEHRWVTLTDLLAWRMEGSAARATIRLSAIAILFCFTFYIAAQFQGAANTFTAVFDFNFVTALLIGAGVVLVYTLWGGFWAVSVTDALQAVLMLSAAILLPAAALMAVGGPSALAIASDAAADGEVAYWSWLGGHGGWFAVGFFVGMVSIGFGPIGQPHLLNRVMALRSPGDIKLARRVALTWFTVVLSGMYLLGVCAHVMLGAQDQSEQVFFVMAERLLPDVLTGVLIAAVLSAIMSTADSQLLVAGSAIQHDLGGGRSGGVLARVAVIGVALVAVALALFLPESIFSRVLFAWNALGAAFGPIVVARLLCWPLRGWVVPGAMSLGFVSTVILYGLPDGPGDVWERFVPFVLAFAALVLGRAKGRRLGVTAVRD